MIKRVWIPGIIFGLVLNLYSAITCLGLFRWIYLDEPMGVLNPLILKLAPSWILIFGLLNLVFSVIFVFLYSLIHKNIPGKGIFKGINFSLFVFLLWFVFFLKTYISMTLSPMLFLYWSINTLIAISMLGILTSIFFDKYK
ncbi:MAG: hypothetical protein WC867_02680 [Candidatus Pacearchaeota archaeon]|jgi:hypothetical protein